MDTYIARSDSERAAEVCERLLQLQPDNPALQTRHGILLMEAGRVDDAAKALLVAAERYHIEGDTQRALEEAIDLQASLPNSSDVALAVGSYHQALGNYPDAVAELSRALHLNPANDLALVRLYSCLVKMEDPTQWDALQSILERSSRSTAETRLFIEEMHKAITRNEAPALYYAVATVAGRAGLEDIAADALDRGILQISLGEPPADGSWLLLEALMAQYRADMAINSKEWGLAVRHYGRTLDLLQPGPDGVVAVESPRPQYDFTRLAEPVQLYYGLAEAHASQNNWDGALQALKALKELMPEDHGVHTRLADIYFRQGHLTDALGELNDLLIHYQKSNDNDKTLETLGHMARLAPNNVAVRRKLSDLYLKLGMTEYGLAESNTLAELQLKAGLLKDAMRTYQKAADLHYTLGQHDKAIGIYEKIVRIAPRDLSARDQLVNMYIQSGKMKEAIASERSLADLFIQEGRTEEAIAALHQLLALSPEDVAGHYALAKQLTSIGEYGQASRLYGRLIRLNPDDDRLSTMQSEMQRMAEEAEAEREASRKRRATRGAHQAASAYGK
jgi:tetratricopeptide (TPR) repeat protein